MSLSLTTMFCSPVYLKTAPDWRMERLVESLPFLMVSTAARLSEAVLLVTLTTTESSFTSALAHVSLTEAVEPAGALNFTPPFCASALKKSLELTTCTEFSRRYPLPASSLSLQAMKPAAATEKRQILNIFFIKRLLV